MKHRKSGPSKRRTFKEVIKDWIWTEGTYSERPKPTVLSEEQIKKTREIRRLIENNKL